MSAAQFRLPFEPATNWTRDAFVLSEANRSAVLALNDWTAMGRGALVLVGPAGSGKSHLAQTWADASGAQVVFPGPAPAVGGNGPVLIEDADLLRQDETLFHLLNQALEGRAVLLTARERPLAWDTRLPDLRSRLNALAVAEIDPPDDAQLRAVLEALFKARHIKPDADLYPYLLARMERSVSAARIFAAKMDDAAAERGRAINRALARELLEETSDLFEEQA